MIISVRARKGAVGQKNTTYLSYWSSVSNIAVLQLNGTCYTSAVSKKSAKVNFLFFFRNGRQVADLYLTNRLPPPLSTVFRLKPSHKKFQTRGWKCSTRADRADRDAAVTAPPRAACVRADRADRAGGGARDGRAQPRAIPDGQRPPWTCRKWHLVVSIRCV